MNHLRHRLFSVVLAVFLLYSLVPPVRASTPALTDMADHWAADVVAQAAALGLVSGYPDGSFRPDNPVSRAEFVKLAVQVRGLPLQPGTAGFADVDGHWLAAAGYLQAAVGAQLVEPSDYGPPGAAPAFLPDRPITRQEVAVIATRVLGKQGAAMVLRGATLPYTDGVPNWASGFVAVAASAGSMRGYPDGSFGGDRTLTRAEAAAVAVRLLQTAVAEGTRTAPEGLVPQAPRSVPIWEANSWQVSTVPFPSRPAGVYAEQTSLAAAPDGTLYLAAGNQIWRQPPDGQATPFYQSNDISGITAGADGALYVAAHHQVLRIAADGAATAQAGSGQDAFADGQGTAAGFRQITGLCADPAGNLYATEYQGRLRKIDPQGNVTTLAGLTPLQQGALFRPGSSGVRTSEGPGYLASLDFNPGPCAADAQGNV